MDQKFKPDSKKPELYPQTLDVISVDGRWAQVMGFKSHSECLVGWLDRKEPLIGIAESAEIDLAKYKLEQIVNQTVGETKDQFKPEELQKVHWGSEQDMNPNLRHQVTVFGKYIKN